MTHQGPVDPANSFTAFFLIYLWRCMLEGRWQPGGGGGGGGDLVSTMYALMCVSRSVSFFLFLIHFSIYIDIFQCYDFTVGIGNYWTSLIYNVKEYANQHFSTCKGLHQGYTVMYKMIELHLSISFLNHCKLLWTWNVERILSIRVYFYDNSISSIIGLFSAADTQIWAFHIWVPLQHLAHSGPKGLGGQGAGVTMPSEAHSMWYQGVVGIPGCSGVT